MYEYEAICERVVDGDTVDLAIDLGLNVWVKERVRLHGIDTPETFGVKKGSAEYEAGKKATARVQELILNRMVRVETIKDRKGKYGRYIARIWLLDGTCLNSLLVSEGLAVEKEY